jgi:hypothetical protein
MRFQKRQYPDVKVNQRFYFVNKITGIIISFFRKTTDVQNFVVFLFLDCSS